MDTAFWIISGITVLGAFLAMTLSNLVHCVLSLILFFLGIAAHYFLLRADFIGAIQILIYIGAVVVLILFAIMLTRNVTGTEGPREVLGVKWWAGSILAGVMAAMLCWVIHGDKISQTLPGGDKAITSITDTGRAFNADF